MLKTESFIVNLYAQRVIFVYNNTPSRYVVPQFELKHGQEKVI